MPGDFRRWRIPELRLWLAWPVARVCKKRCCHHSECYKNCVMQHQHAGHGPRSHFRAGAGKFLLGLADPLKDTKEGGFTCGGTTEPARLWGSCSGPATTVLSPWMHCRVFTAGNIPLPSEQNGFLNSVKKVTSSVTQLSPLVRLLSSVVTASDSTDLRTGRT